MDQGKRQCEKCLCRLCFDNEEGTCKNCEECAKSGGANKVWCLMDCNLVERYRG